MALPDLTILAVSGDEPLLDAMGVSASKLLELNPGHAFVVAAITRQGVTLRYAATADDAAALVASAEPAEGWWTITLVPDAVQDCLNARNATLH